MDRTSVAQARREDAIGKDVLLEGWVRTRRDSKAGFSFLEINDGSCFGNVQVLAPADLPNYESEIKHLTTGCSVAVEGLVNKSPAKGQATEVQARKITVVGRADPEKGRHDGVPAHRCAPATAHQHVRRRHPAAQLRQPLDPQFFPGAGFPLYPHADHHVE